jgi:hypothetical protein
MLKASALLDIPEWGIRRIRQKDFICRSSGRSYSGLTNLFHCREEHQFVGAFDRARLSKDTAIIDAFPE